MKSFLQKIKRNGKKFQETLISSFTDLQTEMKAEVTEIDVTEAMEYIGKNWQHALHLPYIPALSRPGWLLSHLST